MLREPDGKDWVIKEQSFDDPVSGLSFTFEVLPSGKPIMKVRSDDFGEREIPLE